MPDQDSDVNAAILAELKQMNESLTYIRAVAQRMNGQLNEQQNRSSQAQKDMDKMIRNLSQL